MLFGVACLLFVVRSWNVVVVRWLCVVCALFVVCCFSVCYVVILIRLLLVVAPCSLTGD